MLKMDPQVNFEKGQLNEVLLSVANLLDENGDTYIDNMPISESPPFVYTDTAQGIRSFITNYVPYNNQEHKEELYAMTATELIEYLKSDKVYKIEDHYSDTEVRKIIAMRLQISQTTYQKYKKVTLAENISMETLAAIEENQSQYPSIMAEVESQRYYNYGKAFGNILGYTRLITESQYENLKESGYEKDDIVGQVGIESTMEAELKGEKGSKLIEVDNAGRTVFTLDTVEAQVGNDIYLTLDADLQVAVYEALEKRLAEGIIARLQGVAKPSVEDLKSKVKKLQIVFDKPVEDLDKWPEALNIERIGSVYYMVTNEYSKALEEKLMAAGAMLVECIGLNLEEVFIYTAISEQDR